MKKTIIYILPLILTILTSCVDSKEKIGKKSTNKLNNRDSFTVPINYDFDNLGLKLNSSIDDTTSSVDWRWDYMNSPNGMPDTTGIDYYMNYDLPVFSFNGETTLPAMSITTDRKKIKRFSSTIIFHLENEKPESIYKLLDSLTTIDILQDEKVRQTVVKNHKYKLISDNYVETVELQISDEEYGYDRITYEIKTTPHNTVYSK